MSHKPRGLQLGAAGGVLGPHREVGDRLGIGRRGRAAAPRTATAEGLLAATGRARTSDARTAMRAAPGSSGAPVAPGSATTGGLAKPGAPTHAELDGPIGVAASVGSAVQHARDVGRDTVERVEALAGLD